MKRNLLLILLIYSLLLLFPRVSFCQVNEFYLVPVDLQICPGCDSTVQVNININAIDYIRTVVVPLLAEGTSDPVLDTALTGGLSSANPYAFFPPSLVSDFEQRIVNPYGPPTDPMLFVAVFGYLLPADGLYCRMFYKVSGPGTLTMRTAIHSLVDSIRVDQIDGSPASINWPAAGEVGSFSVTQLIKPRGNVNCDEVIGVADVVYIVSYLFRGGPIPHPLQNGDVNCDGKVTVSDVLYLVNYLFKSGPPPPC
ncbi:MAG TPA: dockerin type I repeat-containing protein [Terriglobales bacterium]|nr:dockerin type I repeat-containing protein [Terriglobales bacterium]